MPLPILKVEHQPTPATLVRYFHQCQRTWASHLADPHDLDFGTAFANLQMDQVWDANAVHDARVPPGMTAEQVVQSAERWFADQHSRCCKWVLNPSAPPEETLPLTEHLSARGSREWSVDVMHLNRLPPLPPEMREDLTIIPARASFRHMQSLADQAAAEVSEPQCALAQMQHLDDPHWDCLLAMKDGTAVATVGVLSVGEIGLIEDLFVTAPMRNQKIGTTMMIRAMEICARSLFKHVFLSVAPENAAALKLYGRFGFEKIGAFTSHIHAQGG